jgi:hypothetical protein
MLKLISNGHKKLDKAHVIAKSDVSGCINSIDPFWLIERQLILEICHLRIKVNNIMTWFLAHVIELSCNLKTLNNIGSVVKLG